jgi:hypothetical protein
MALSTEQKAGRLAAYDGFQARVIKALVAAAIDVKAEDPVYDTSGVPIGGVRISSRTSKRANLANSILADPKALAARTSSLVAAQPGISSLLEPVDVEDDANTGSTLDDAVSYNDIAFTVNSLYDNLAGVDPWESTTSPSGASLAAGYAGDPAFQARVYQLGAQIANEILVATPPAADADAAVKAVDTIKRLFAIKYQAGRYIGNEYRLNYAVNVLADPGLATKAPEDITDAEIKARLLQLTTIFATSMAGFKAAGVDTGLLA